MSNGSMSIDQFRSAISNKIKEYKNSLSVRGKSASIYLTEDIDNLFIGKKELTKLCHAFLNDQLNEFEIAYVTDALLLSEKVMFENEEIREAFELLTDSEVHGALTKGDIHKMLETFR